MTSIHVRKLTIAVTVKKPSNMLEITRKCLNIRIFSKNADVGILFWNFVFIKCFINLLYTIVPNINVIEQFSREIWVLKFASNLRFSPSNIFSCCRHPSVLCDILAMPPPQTTHLCFLKPLIIYLTSEHSDNFFLSRWYLPQKMPGL